LRSLHPGYKIRHVAPLLLTPPFIIAARAFMTRSGASH
jgi:hypothetical protein